MSKEKHRCHWPGNDDLMIAYHDEEWGVPLHEDAKLFEFLVLDAFQAGLSWRIVLYKREGFRKAFAGFDAEKVARYDESRIARLEQEPAIIRNKLKIRATVNNAQRFLEVQETRVSFAEYIWQFTEGKPIVNEWKSPRELPASSPQSEKMSKDLRRRGFKFVGPTICYAFMQAAGMVNDHIVSCFRYRQLQAP